MQMTLSNKVVDHKASIPPSIQMDAAYTHKMETGKMNFQWTFYVCKHLCMFTKKKDSQQTFGIKFRVIIDYCQGNPTVFKGFTEIYKTTNR